MESQNNFKGTTKKWNVVEYAGTHILSDGYNYGSLNLLDAEDVGLETAQANAKLAEGSPEMLEMLQYVINISKRKRFPNLDRIQNLINKLTN